MANSKVELSELFHFRPGPIYDPVPWWLLQYLEKEQIVQVARIQLEMQRAIVTAYGKALNQIHEGVLQTAVRPAQG
jgi:hypothetical protein